MSGNVNTQKPVPRTVGKLGPWVFDLVSGTGWPADHNKANRHAHSQVWTFDDGTWLISPLQRTATRQVTNPLSTRKAPTMKTNANANATPAATTGLQGWLNRHPFINAVGVLAGLASFLLAPIAGILHAITDPHSASPFHVTGEHLLVAGLAVGFLLLVMDKLGNRGNRHNRR